MIRRRDRHREQILRAFRRGHTSHAQSNSKVTFDGEARTVSTFERTYHYVMGRMDFFYYDTNVLTVDFTNDMATDYGYLAYSMRTAGNIRDWLFTLRSLNVPNVRSLEDHVWVPDWTTCGRRRRDGHVPRDKTHSQIWWETFYTGAPWIHRINGYPWFHGPSYNEATVYSAMQVLKSLHDGVSWHWFTVAWEDGRLVKRFIDADAEKRFHRRKAT